MRACVLIVILFSGSEAMAVLPPRIARQRKQRLYATARAMQKTAPEVLVIKVERVRVKSSYASRRYHSGSTRKSHRSRRILKGQELRVDARIIRVVRSKRRLRRGQRVRFTYKLRYQYQPGPRIYNPLGLTHATDPKLPRNAADITSPPRSSRSQTSSPPSAADTSTNSLFSSMTPLGPTRANN